MPTETIAATLRQLREARGWTQQRLASESGLGQATISLVEAGLRAPGLATIRALARALGVAPGRLLDG